MSDDRRLIEDYLPIEAISEEASREKNVRKGHISTLHLWWARRPLVACRAAVYGALVPASRFKPKNGPEEKRDSLARANAARFVEALCKYPADPQVIAQAQQHILEAHAERLTEETGKKITIKDIEEGRSPRPKVLDMFAGGGAIPLEALRLGCVAYALDLNPVAHIIELCTLVYPQKYGKVDENAKGSAKDGTWAGLAEEVRCWGIWVLERVNAEIGDLYPCVPDPKAPKAKQNLGQSQLEMAGEGFESKGQQKLGVEVSAGYLTPVAYLWTRTVRCKNPSCGATVPLVRQTWLCKKKDRYVALKMIVAGGKKQIRFKVVAATGENDLGFDPAAFSKGGNATCPFCGTVADIDYVKQEGWDGRIGAQMMSVICSRTGRSGKEYYSADDLPGFVPNSDHISQRITALETTSGLTAPSEPIANLPANCRDNSLGITVRPYGLRSFGTLFTPRQTLCLLSFAAAIRDVEAELRRIGYAEGYVKAVVTNLSCVLDKQADFNSSLCVLKADGGRGIVHTFGRQALPMVWDFAEANPFSEDIACWQGCLSEVVGNIQDLVLDGSALVARGTAAALEWPSCSFDAVITDPPYYDNVPYADISDFFYVWLKRTVGHLYPEHFATELTPKKSEAIADSTWRRQRKGKAGL